MKKTSLLFAVVLFAGMLFCSQAMAQGRIELGATKSAQQCANFTDSGFTASFSFSSIESYEVSTEKGVFSHITMEGTYPAGNIGDPTVPAVNKLIAVPIGVSNVTVEVKNYTTEVYSLADYGIHRLDPQQTPLRKDQKPGDLPFDYNTKAYSTPGFSERAIAMFQIEGTMRGIQIGALTINPVQYDAVNNLVRVYNNVEVEVRFGQYDQAAAYNEFARTFSPYYAGLYKSMFNSRQILDVYDDHPDLWQNPVKMLVITNRAFESTIQDWVNWKTTKGIHVDVNYTDQIGSTASAIKSFIQNKYNTDAPTFLMIMGDKNMVVESGTGSATSCVTDLNYSSVDGDEFADMFHSRFPAENVSQMTSMLNKALEYEQYTMPDPSYLSNVLLIAGEDSGWGVTVGRPTIWYASNYYYNEDHGFNNVYEYSHGTYTGCYSHLNTGVGFVNYTAHGSNTSWAGPSFTNSDVNNLTNVHKYFLAMGNCCQAADWGISGACFGETMVRAENKAAYAYIGSCPSTYWLNDYYFGVGATSRADGTMPTYEETTMGCYDAIWDDDAYNTVCAIPYIGNLAGNAAGVLGYTLHISTLYCWQAYHVLGDGSIMPFRVQPTANDISHMAIVPIGMSFYEVGAAPGSFVSLTKDGVILGTGIVDNSGTINLEIEPVTSGGDVTLCVTHPQHIPVVETIPAAALDGAYISVDSYTPTSAQVGEQTSLSITFKNVGTVATSGNTTATLSCDDSRLTFNTHTKSFGSLAPDASTTVDGYSYTIAEGVADGTVFRVNVTCTNGSTVWEGHFNITATAPNLVISNFTSTELMPGSNGTLTFTITNEGSADAQNVHFELGCNGTGVTLSNNSADFASIAAGASETVSVNISIDSNVSYGTSYTLNYSLTADHFSSNGTQGIVAGIITEGFETGNFTACDWTFGGSANWTVVSNEHYEGSYSAKSGAISHSQQTDLVIEVNVLSAGDISFYYKVSSETNYDKLHFYIDNVEKGVWSGTVAWTQATYPVTVGSHTFKWSYTKDSSVNSGSDCAWIDEVVFPPIAVPVSAVIPTVATTSATNVTQTTATGGGNVTDDGGAEVTARGICWSTSHNPTVSGSHTTNGTGTGSFTANMTGLTPGTTYYVRAYATNTKGTAYGNEVSFTTQSASLATVTTISVSDITETTATSGGNITANGGAAVTARGICWSTSHNPTVSGYHTTNGTGNGAFTANMTGLTPGTTYYVRAYATNSAGTAYGSEKTFTTLQDATGLIGDADVNGQVNINDVLAIMRHALQIQTLDGQGLQLADVNGDGNVDMNDAVILLRTVLGIAK